MPIYDYVCLTCEKQFDVMQSIHDDRLIKCICPNCKTEEPCEKIITGGTGVIFKGNGWSVSSTTRGYKGKYSHKLRPRGSPVDAPSNKPEADRQFQNWVDSGGLTGVKPSINTYDKDNPSRPQTAEEQIDKKI